MPNLATEYTKRHKIKGAFGVHEGVVFLKSNKNYYCAHTAICPKVHNFCNFCLTTGFTLEVFTYTNDVVNSICHQHVQADANIVSISRRVCNEEVNPVLMTQKHEMEYWLWNMFLRGSLLSKTKQRMDAIKERPTPQEQMFFCALNFTGYFHNYTNLVNYALAGRKYILS